MATLKNTKIDDTGYLGVPTGSNAQRPNTASAGMIRWNTDNSVLEGHDGTEWKQFSLTEYVKTYSVTDNTTSTNEGTTITFTTTTDNVPDGSTLYYTLSGVDSNDVSTGTSGNFTINNNSGTVNVSITNDLSTEGSETLTFQVRTDDISGTIVASNTTTINDTSLTPYITNGLLVHIDASNPSSYPGTGNNVYDLSGNGANGTLENGVSFVSDGNASYFEFDGVNDYINSTLSQNYLDCTVVFEPDFSQDNSSNIAGIIAVGSGTEDKSLRFEDVDGTGPWSLASRNPGDGNDWANPTATTYYVNNSVSNTLVSGWNVFGGYRTNQTTFPANFAYHLGTSSYPNRYFKGKIAAILMYNRQLSATEQETNFNYFKDRFGL